MKHRSNRDVAIIDAILRGQSKNDEKAIASACADAMLHLLGVDNEDRAEFSISQTVAPTPKKAADGAQSAQGRDPLKALADMISAAANG